MVEEVFRTIREVNKGGATILLIEQNALAALRIAQYGYVLETGKVVLEGPSQDLLKDERVRKAYLGE
jgi:branched-chain amino acid transport system ATP-binding protein